MPVGGPVGCLVIDLVVVGGPVRGLVDGPVCRTVGAVGCPSLSGRWSGGPVGCLVNGPVGDSVGDPVGGLVGGPACGLVDGAVCGAVRAVCGPGDQMLAHRSRKPRIPGFARSGVAVVLQCPGRVGVAVVLRWSGQWSQSMVRSVVRSVVWSIRSVIRSAIRSVVWSVVWFVVWSMVQFVVRSVWSVVRRPASFKCLDMGRNGLVFFCNLLNSGTRVRAHFAHKMWSALLPGTGCGGPRRSTRQLFQNL